MSNAKFVVVCHLPNASTLMNGVKFELSSNKAFSEPVDEATADYFASIDGFDKTEIKASKKPTAAEEKAAAEAKSAEEAANADIKVGEKAAK